MRGLNSLWISARDLAQVVCLAIESSVRFGIYNATSNNYQRHWDLTATREELGYAPEDDVRDFEDPSSEEGAYVDPRAGVLRDSGGA